MVQFYYKIQRLLQIVTVQSMIKRLITIKSQKNNLIKLGVLGSRFCMGGGMGKNTST